MKRRTRWSGGGGFLFESLAIIVAVWLLVPGFAPRIDLAAGRLPRLQIQAPPSDRSDATSGENAARQRQQQLFAQRELEASSRRLIAALQRHLRHVLDPP